jgi:hypothetical protein
MEEEEEKKKIGFFRKLYLIITDFRIYPLIVKEKFISSFGYFIKLISIISVIITLMITFRLFNFISYVINNYNLIPEFTLINGELNVKNKILIHGDDSAFIVDTERSNKDYIDGEIGQDLRSYDSYVIIDKDEIYINNGTESFTQKFKDMGIDVTRQELLDVFNSAKSNVGVQAIIFISLFLGTFLSVFAFKFMNVIILAILAVIINSLFRSDISFSGYIKICMAVLTLPIIVELISILTIGGVPTYAYYTYHILSYVYLYYAIRAIKLDYIITNIPGENMKEKLEKMIEQVASEIEKKVKGKEEDKEQEEPEEKKDDDKNNNEK